MPRSDNKQVLLDLVAAANAGDLDGIAQAYADDYRDHTLSGTRAGAHKHETLEAFRELLRAFPDAEHVVHDIVAEGDRVVVRLGASGTHRADYKGVAPTGRRVTMVTTAIYRVRGGRIVERWCDGSSAVRDRVTEPAGAGAERVREAPAPGAPTVARAREAPWIVDGSGGRYQELALRDVSLTRFRLPGSTRFEEHAHAAEQITMVLAGELTFRFGGEAHVLGPGDAIAIPGDVPHSVEAGPEPVDAVDSWSPPPTHLGADPL